MIDAPGKITAVDGDYAIVRMDETGCGRCHEPGGCGGDTMGRIFCSVPRTFRVLNPEHSAVGERVTIVIAAGAVRRSAARAYGFPLLALFAGAFGGSFLAGEAGAMAGAMAGLLCGWLALRYAGRAPDGRSQPHIKT